MNRAVFGSLARYYVRRPVLFWEHIGRALLILVTQGRAQLRRDFASVSRTADRVGVQATTFRELWGNRERNAAALSQQLAPLAGQEPGTTLDDLVAVERHLLRRDHLFDAAFYRRRYGPIAATGDAAEAALEHYLGKGAEAGNWPNPHFEPRRYVQAYPELAAGGMNPILHYAYFGWREGRGSRSAFDADQYLDAHPKVRRDGISPLIHYLGRLAAGETPSLHPAEGRLSRRGGTILLVTHDMHVGGAQRVARSLAAWLLSHTRYDVRIVAVADGDVRARFEAVAPVFCLADRAHGGALEEKLRAFAGGDVVAIFANSVASGAFFDHWPAPTPAIAWLHEMPKMLARHESRLATIVARCAHIVSGSPAVEAALVSRFDVPAEQVTTVPPFVEVPDSLPTEAEKAAARRELGIAEDQVLICGCGVMHWRKRPDLFIEVAAHVAEQVGQTAQFLWIGDGEDREACAARIAELGLDDTVRLFGFAEDVNAILRLADVFLLPSEEDPFPLVCLNAALAGAPIVCFAEAGGMEGFVTGGAGVAVPHLDAAAMAKATLAYLRDAPRRRADGARARAKVLDGHTVDRIGPALLHHLRQAAGLAPAVSVVLPNYNCGPYLEARLTSIRAQSFQDFELILLDDASTDGSEEMLEQEAERRPGSTLLLRQENGASPFAQWLAGMDAASAELVWLAEADDWADPDFLAALLPHFDDRNVRLAHTASVPVDAAGDPLGAYDALYLDRIAPGRWQQSFIATDQEEATAGLGLANTIPNASAVMLRRFQPSPEERAELSAMRLAGDWLFYLMALRGGFLSYEARPLNYHRRHGETQTARLEGTADYFRETAKVHQWIARTWQRPMEARDKARRFVEGDLQRFDITDPAVAEAAVAPLSAPGRKVLPTILFVISDLGPGGGQIFAIRLANAWVARGGRAVLLNVGRFADHPGVRARVDGRVPILRIDTAEGEPSRIVRRFGVDIIHSAIWWADKFVQSALPDLPASMPWVITAHGCYETLLADPSLDPTLPSRIEEIIQRPAAWVVVAEKNKALFAEHGQPARVLRIDNGVEAPTARSLDRAALGLREDAVVFCLAARAIAEKGWQHAVRIVAALNARGLAADLLLLGSGPAEERIRARTPRHVVLTGHVGDPAPYFATADIGLLPTRFAGESQPLALIEMMAHGLPVLSTDVGEIPDLIGTGSEAAGRVIPLRRGRVDVDGFVAAAADLMDPATRQMASAAARARYEARYSLDRMVGAYAKLYDEVLASAEAGPRG
ncbi:MAG: glycosyltransferase [Pseudomonadota bacterium]